MGQGLGPHSHTPAPTARGWRTPTARPEGGQSGEGQRLTSDAPHNGGRPPPPWDALPPTPQRATPARRGAHCGAAAGSPRPHRPHPGHTGRGTLAARSRGQAAGGGTAPDTERPPQRWQATPPGDGPPPPPLHAAPTGHAGQGDSVGPPHPHTCAHSTWVADPNSPPSGRAVGGGTAPDLRRPSQWWKAPPPGPPFRHLHSEQRRPARAHAVGLVLGPHARTNRTRDTRVAEPRLPAPEDGRPGEGQRLTPDAPHNGGRPTPPGTAPNHPHGTQPPQGMQATGAVLGPHTHTPAPTARGWRTPTARPVGGQLGKGKRLTSDAPHNGGRHPPRTRPSATPTASNAGPQGRTLWRRCWVPTPAPTAPGTHESQNPGCPLQRTGGRGRTAPDTRRPSQRWQATPPGDGPATIPAALSAHRACRPRDSVGPPHSHTRAHSMWVADPNSPPSGRAVGGGTAPDVRRPSQWWKAPPLGTPFRHSHSEQRRPARAHAVGPVLGPHARTDRTRDTRVAEPWLPAPEDGRPGEGQRLTPDAPHNAGRPPPPGTPPPLPSRHAAPPGHPRQGDSVGPPHQHACAHSMWVGDPNSQPSGRAVQGGGAPDHRRPSQRWKASPRERPSATPTGSNASPQGRTLWGRCRVPTPAPTAPGTHGSRNPGYPPQRKDGRGRDSA